MKINKLLESKRTDDYLSIKEINWLKDNPGQEIKKTHYKVSYNDYVNANTNEPMGGHFTVVENQGRDTTIVDGVQELKDYIIRRYNKYFEESISSSEPVVKFQGKSSHTFTKDKKWEVDFDEAGNILARTRYGKPYYFKGHINDKVNDFPSTDEDNIILAAREQYRLKFGKIDEAMDGFVRTYCDSCGKPNRVKVHFPSYNKGFDTTTYKCKYCNTKNELTDPHEYNDDGTLKEDTAVSSGYDKLKFGKKTESFEKDGGPFWYFSKHGLGPGMLPKGVNVVDTIEDDNFGTYVALDKVLSTQELKDYELKERTPEKKDLFRVDESKQLNETKYGKDELWNQINNNEWAYNTLSNKVKTAVEKGLPKERIIHIVRNAIFSMKDDFGRIPTTQAERLELAKDFVEDELQGYSFEDGDSDIPSWKRTGTWSRLSEAFKPSNSGIQSVKCYNQYNYTIQELRVDNDKKTFERGQFTFGKPDKKTKNRQEFEDIVDTLKDLGYTEIKSDYRSMRNKSRKGKPTKNEGLSPQKGDHVRMDHYSKLNNGQEGTVTGRIGELCSVTWDDGTKSKEIKGYLKVIERPNMNEAHYGGAFDIADDQYFTREDIENAAEEVLNHINETFTEPYHLGGTWFESGKWIVNVQGEDFDEYEVSLPIDMRKIKAPNDLKDKFSLGMAAKLIAQIKEYNGLNEDTAVSSTFEFDDDVDDLTYYYDDEEFKRMLDEEPYNEIASKQVPDSDGFMTDYTMYRNMNDGTYVFIFGDKDIYTPGNSDFDWECDTEEEAREWFDNYVGFDDDLLDEGWSSILEEAETETSPIVHKKSDGSYLVQSDNGDGYTAFNKDNVCQGHISASNETEAKNKFNSNKFDE